jgi:hypothetical protein
MSLGARTMVILNCYNVIISIVLLMWKKIDAKGSGKELTDKV